MKQTAWTKEQDSILVVNIINAINNGMFIRNSFNITSKELDVDVTSCLNRWNKISAQYKDLVKAAKLLNTQKIKENNQNKIKKNAGFRDWTKEEDLKLTNAVLECISNKDKITDTLKEISKEIDRSFSACQLRWYEDLRHLHIKEKRTAAMWTKEEDETLIKIIKSEFNTNKSMKDIMKEASKKLNRSWLACSMRWNIHLKEKHLEIDTTNISSPRWAKKEDEILVKSLQEQFKLGQTIRDSSIVASKLLNRTPISCEDRWRKIKKNYPQVQQHFQPKRNWSKKEDMFIIDTINKYKSEGKSISSALAMISKELNKSNGSCSFRWYKTLSHEVK